MPDARPAGVMDATYHQGRRKKLALRYRLRRRGDEVLRSIRRYRPEPAVIADVGTADGMMLSRLLSEVPGALGVGLDYALDLLESCPDPDLPRVRADAMRLPLRSGSVDVVVATAVIEHVPAPEGMLRECRRVLRTGGIVVLTTPDPRWERVATAIGHLEDEDHNVTLGLRELARLSSSVGLEVLDVRKFMVSPVGLPGERAIERVLHAVGATFFLLNQLVVARRVD